MRDLLSHIQKETRTLRRGQIPSRPHLFFEDGRWQVSLYMGHNSSIESWGLYHQTCRFAQRLNERNKVVEPLPLESFKGPFVQSIGRGIRGPAITARTLKCRLGENKRGGLYLPHIWMQYGVWHQSLVHEKLIKIYQIQGKSYYIENAITTAWVQRQNELIDSERYKDELRRRYPGLIGK